jgi:hypothetical protein
MSTRTRVLYKGQLFLDANPDTYQDAISLALDLGLSPSDLSIHPDDKEALQKALIAKEIDRQLSESGMEDRDKIVWTSNMALINLYLICKLVKVGENQWADNIPHGISELLTIADTVLQSIENNGSIAGILGVGTVVEKAVAMGNVAGNAYSQVLANPPTPSIP